jgi:hypothetical protein
MRTTNDEKVKAEDIPCVVDQFKAWLEPRTVIKAQFPEGTIGYSWLYAAFADAYHLADTASFERGKAEGIEMAKEIADKQVQAHAQALRHSGGDVGDLIIGEKVAQTIADSIRGLLGGEGDAENKRD